MKKIFFAFMLFIAFMSVVGCASEREENLSPPKNKPKEEIKSMIVPSGETLQTRISVPKGYERKISEEGSLTDFLRNYKMKEDNSPVLLYNGEEKKNQSAHAAVFELPVENVDLQQCADSVMRVYAEYYWENEKFDRISFRFTNGFLCEYLKWREGFRVVNDERGTRWVKSASYDDSYENFLKYMKIVFSYAGTASMEAYETEKIDLSEMKVGDVLLKGGSPGHIVMVVDLAENGEGKKAFLLAQGYMPAQDFHVIKNPMHEDDPWYYEEEMKFPVKTAEYIFDDEEMIKRVIY